jgi:4-alpha-glucanotransferase
VSPPEPATRAGRESGTLVPVTSTGEFRHRAAARGIAVSYRDWHGREVQVPDDTLKAILEALGDPPSLARPRVTPSRQAPFPRRRAWGFMVQLYSVRSRASWGHGDFRDLADLATWSARDLGAAFVLVNPLHAAEPLPPVSPSPYLPMSRRYLSPLYLRIEDIPEYARLTAAGRARVDALGVPLRAANRTAALIDRDAVWTAKRAALEVIGTVPLTAERERAFTVFRDREGRALDDWATWCAIAEVSGPDWRTWRASPQRPPRHRIAFHAWTQWLAAEQAAAAQRAATEAGMAIGVVADLAVGSHPGGADAWARQDVVVPGISVGAPPDEFNQRGQDWTLPPWHPERLAALGGRPVAELIEATTRHAGGLRIDHVMGLSRQWWIPAGMPPDRGAYVRYDHELLGGVLAGCAARAGAVAIGEDLGTVEPWLPAFLAERNVLGTSMLWFERQAGGSPRPPGEWRRGCLATVGTHDMPPAAAFLAGEQVTLRAKLGLLTRAEDEERRVAAADLSRFLAALHRAGVLPGGATPFPEQFTAALYAYLAMTPAVLIGVSLAEAAGERRPQNMPGTTDEYPNWRIPLTDGNGDPVLLEDLPGHAGILSVTGTLRRTLELAITGRRSSRRCPPRRKRARMCRAPLTEGERGPFR